MVDRDAGYDGFAEEGMTVEEGAGEEGEGGVKEFGFPVEEAGEGG